MKGNFPRTFVGGPERGGEAVRARDTTFSRFPEFSSFGKEKGKGKIKINYTGTKKLEDQATRKKRKWTMPVRT